MTTSKKGILSNQISVFSDSNLCPASLFLNKTGLSNPARTGVFNLAANIKGAIIYMSRNIEQYYFTIIETEVHFGFLF